MTLQEYLENINDMVKNDPSILELPVIFSKDSEGNQFNEVEYTPTLGYFEDNDFTSNEEDLEDYIINAICIN